MVWVHLMRHGIAVDPSDPSCPTDPERTLTEKGKIRARLAVAGLRRIGIAPELILASPYVRAQQTAAIALAVFDNQSLSIETSELLVPMADPSDIVDFIRARSEENIMCVGHLPNLDRVVAHLIGADNSVTALKKAGAASLEIRVGRPAAGRALLTGVYPASVLRKLGGSDD